MVLIDAVAGCEENNLRYFVRSGFAVAGETAEEAAQDEEGLQTMRMLGNNMAWLLKCIELGKQAGIAPERERKIMTNFIR